MTTTSVLDDDTIVEFNVALTSLVTALMADAQNDTAYNAAKTVWLALTKKLAEDATFCCSTFVHLVRSNSVVRECISKKNTAALEVLCIDALPSSQALFDELSNESSFKHDTIKKMWKRIQKLVYKCRLDALFGTENTPQPTPTTKTRSVIVATRVTNFNTRYRAFLDKLSATFPPDPAVSTKPSPLTLFDDAVDKDDESIMTQYKELLMPLVPKIVSGIQSKNIASQADALKPYFGEHPTWFKRLPCVGKSALTVDEHWASEMTFDDPVAHDSYLQLDETDRAAYANENGARVAEWVRVTGVRDAIMKALLDLTGCMSGIDSLINSPIVAALKEKAIEIMERDKLTVASMTPTSPGFNRAAVMKLVTDLLHEIPKATGGKISDDDIQELITSFMGALAGGQMPKKLPDSFAEVFSPDMIDPDCIDVLGDIPGVGDVLAPLLASMEGQMHGKTGAKSPFASVKNPAWLTKK